MATQEQIQLVLSTIGASGVVDLKTKYAELVAQLGEVTAAMGRDDKAAKDLEADFQALSSSAKNLGGTIAQLEAAQAREAAAAQKAADAKVRAFDQAIAALNREQAAEDRAAARATDTLDRRAAAQRKAADAESAAAAKSAAATVRASTATGKYQQNIIGLGNAFNDFFSVSGSMSQRLNAIANNMPMLLAGFGNLGLALSGILPIIALLLNTWPKIHEYFTGIAGEFGKTIEGMKERLAELEAKKIKVGFDLMEIDALKAQIKEVQDAIEVVNRLKSGQSKHERESGQAVAAALDETKDQTGRTIASPEILKRLSATKALEMEQVNDPFKQLTDVAIPAIEADIKKFKAKSQELLNDGTLRGTIEAGFFNARVIELTKILGKRRLEAETLRGKIGEQAEIEVGKVAGEAATKSGALQKARQAELIRLARKTGLGALAGQVEGHTPEQVKAEAEVKKQEDEAEARAKLSNDADRERGVILTKQGENLQAAADTERMAIERNQKIALDEIRDKNRVQPLAEQFYSEARKRGLNAVQAYEEVWRKLYGFLKKELTDMDVSGTGQLVEGAAKEFAGHAPQFAEAQRKALAEQGKAAVARQVAQENASIEKSGLDKQAALMMADMQRQMGVKGTVTTPGGERPLTATQQFDVVRQAMLGRLMAMNRGMRKGAGRDQAEDLAMVIAAMGKKMLEDMARGAMNQNFAFQQQQMQAFGQPMGPVGVGVLNQMQQMARDQALPRPGAGAAAPFMAPGAGFRSVPPQAPGPQAALGVIPGIQQVEAATIGRLRNLEQVVAGISRRTAQNLAQLNGRNEPMQLSALPFGIA